MKNIRRSLFFYLFSLLSVSFAQEGNPPKKEPASSLKISLNRSQKDRFEFLLEVANAYVIEQDLSSAIVAYERILESDPMHEQARYIVAHIYISAKQYQKAEVLLLDLTSDHPDDFKLFNNLAWLYATAEDPSIRNGKAAVKYAQEALLLAPTDYHVWSTLSEAHYISGDYEKAYRAVNHMAALVARYANDVTEESVKSYNEQIYKCKRAMDADEVMKEGK